MQILMLAENDPAGTAIQLCKAINVDGHHSCRLITWQTRYLCNFEKDIHLEDNPEWALIEKLLQESDVFHFHMLANEDVQLGPFLIRDYISGKKIIRHHHGHYKFRENLQYYQDLYNRLNDPVIVSTPDMVELFPPGRSSWLPNLILYHDPKYSPKELWDLAAPLKIAHSPTRKQIKSTDVIIEVVKSLQQEGYQIELDLIEMQPHDEVLRRKRLADIVFDQMNYSFGISSLEAFALGVPAIFKLDSKQEQLIEQTIQCPKSQLPWYNVQTKEDLINLLKYLAMNKKDLTQLGQKAREFMEQYWSIEKILYLYFTQCNL